MLFQRQGIDQTNHLLNGLDLPYAQFRYPLGTQRFQIKIPIQACKFFLEFIVSHLMIIGRRVTLFGRT